MLIGRDAAAQPSKAEEAFARGVHFFDTRDYPDAADAFAQAYETDHQEKYLWNLAVAELRAERFVGALHHFREYKALPSALPTHLALLDELTLRASKNVGYFVVVAPPALTVTIDGKAVGTTPLSAPIDVAVGPHEVRVAGGPYDFHTEASAYADTVTKVRMEAPSAEAAPASAPSADAFTVAAPAAVAPRGPERPSMVVRNGVVLSLAALAVGAAVTGTVFEVMLGDDQNTHNRYVSNLNADATALGYPRDSICLYAPSNADCAGLRAINAKWASDQDLATGFFITAGGAAAAGLLTYFLWPRPHAARSALVFPELGPGHGGVTLVGSF